MLGEPYPSEGMSRMLDECDALEQQVYLEKYAIFTPFATVQQITYVVEYMKRTVPPLLAELLRAPHEAKRLAEEEATRLTELAELCEVPPKEMLYFQKQIRQRFIDARHCFIALTSNNKERNYYDLAEKVEDLRYITVDECGNRACRAKDKALLERNECARCRKAAYCNRDCQCADWAYHKKYCASLGAKRDTAVDMATVEEVQ